MNHYHLDLVGGLSGDMFIGAVLDCVPELADELSDVVTAAGFKDLGILELESIESVVPTYLWRFRSYGEFHKEGEA